MGVLTKNRKNNQIIRGFRRKKVFLHSHILIGLIGMETT